MQLKVASSGQGATNTSYLKYVPSETISNI